MTVLQGKVVLIVDGATPLGRCLGLECARQGASIAVWALEGARAQAVVDEVSRQYGIRARAYQVSFSEQERVEAAAEAVRRDFQRIDVLICNIDFMDGVQFLSSTRDTICSSITQNAIIPMWVTRLVLPRMLELKSGHIVLFGTSSDGIGTSRLVNYCAGKHAVMGFYTALRHELRILGKKGTFGDAKLDKNIILTLICPTLVCQRVSNEARTERSSYIPSLWLHPEPTARSIIRAIHKNQTKVVLPQDFSLISGLISILPDVASTWIREKLNWTTSMDHYQRNTA